MTCLTLCSPFESWFLLTGLSMALQIWTWRGGGGGTNTKANSALLLHFLFIFLFMAALYSVVWKVAVACTYWHFLVLHVHVVFIFTFRPKQLTTFSGLFFVCKSVEFRAFFILFKPRCVLKSMTKTIVLWTAEEEVLTLQICLRNSILQSPQNDCITDVTVIFRSRCYSEGPVSCIYWQMLLAI